MSEPLRILHVLEPEDGGVPAHVRTLSAGLVARGHEVIAAARPTADVRPAHAVPLPFTGAVPAPRQDAAVLRGLTRLLREQPFDVVHTHGQKAGILGRLAAHRAGVPVVYQPHSFVHVAQGRLPRRGAGVRRVVGRRLERGLGRWTAALVAISSEEAVVVCDERLLPADRIARIPNGVAVDTAVPPDPALIAFRGDGPLVGIVAGLRDQKGHEVLLDALALLDERGTPVRCAIVGNGPLGADIRERAGAGTLVVGFDGRVEPYLAALDVFVLPSYWEGLPLAILEAMAMGLPVVATAVGGTIDAVEHGETGLLVPPGDPAALADALAALIADPVRRAAMGAAGLARQQSRYTAERMVDDVEALYRGIAAR